MSTYTKATDFLAKDSLPLNNAGKYVKGSEIDTEFDAIETADADNMKKSAMGTGVETFLGTPSSANLAAAVTGETGSGALVFATSPTLVTPTLVTPTLGTPASGTLTNCTIPQAGVTGLTTADSPQFTAVNIGHASDTTLTRVSAGVVAIEGVNICTDGAWTDYSASSTIVGWSSFTTKHIFYKDIGKTRFVYFKFDGTSNSTTTSFTLPSASSNTVDYGGPTRTDDNGVIGLGHYVLLANSATVTAYYGVTASAWTASGTKRLIGQFTYQLP